MITPTFQSANGR